MKLGLCIWGVRTAWHTEDDGEFFCADCGGDRAYHRRTGTRRLTVLNVPLLTRGPAGTVIECTACHRQFGSEVLLRPTTTRFSAMLRDAVHTIALAVLTAGGATGRPAREAAVGAVRSAGFTDCTEDQLLGLLAAIVADEGRYRHRRRTRPRLLRRRGRRLRQLAVDRAARGAGTARRPPRPAGPRAGAAAGRPHRARRRPVPAGRARGAGGGRPLPVAAADDIDRLLAAAAATAS